jgi:proteasome lid subunit RPN8/RPN11
MLRFLASSANQIWGDLQRSLLRARTPVAARPKPTANGAAYPPLQRLILTDGVSRTLFEEYARHRAEARGQEETGWVLLGLRQAVEATVLATLPAGAERDAGVAHVRFNCEGQAVGSRMVRQLDRRLTILGIVHTHPGSLRHPSDADYAGDVAWVAQLRGGEGVFGIGTADGPDDERSTIVGEQPKPHLLSLADLNFAWYALGAGENTYRPLPVALTLGPDLARPLHCVWPIIEAHAVRLERLHRQQAGVSCDVVAGNSGPALAVNVPLALPEQSLRVLLEGKRVRYFLVRDGELLAVDCSEERVDRAVYLLLAELAE